MISAGYKSAYQQGYSDAMRDFRKEPKTDVLDNIRADIAAIAINGQIDVHTAFIRTGDQVKQMALEIIDKYKAESEE